MRQHNTHITAESLLRRPANHTPMPPQNTSEKRHTGNGIGMVDGSWGPAVTHNDHTVRGREDDRTNRLEDHVMKALAEKDPAALLVLPEEPLRFAMRRCRDQISRSKYFCTLVADAQVRCPCAGRIFFGSHKNRFLNTGFCQKQNSKKCKLIEKCWIETDEKTFFKNEWIEKTEQFFFKKCKMDRTK